MIHLPVSVRVYLCLAPTDMRRSFDGLHALVRDHLQLDAFAGHLYIFANRRKEFTSRLPLNLLLSTFDPATRLFMALAATTINPKRPHGHLPL
jgi:hypothetical protein